MRFTFTEANLLPDNHPQNIQYNDFLSLFGEEGSVLLIATKDPALFSTEKLTAWKALSEQLTAFDEIDVVLSIDNVKELVKNKQKKKFELTPLLEAIPKDSSAFAKFKQKLFLELPFYQNLLFNKDSGTVRMAIYMNQDVVNSSARKDFVLNTFIPLIDAFEKKNEMKIHRSGMPYIRTLNAQNIVDEIGLFVFAAIGVTSLIFFLFFRSIRATFISVIIVLMGVSWALGTLGLLGYEITVLSQRRIKRSTFNVNDAQIRDHARSTSGGVSITTAS
ncbi:MAG TPA: hypothetical protein DCE62_00375 [Glaciecola sp.]|nr:hypothetical protein [Glaciecola sp.]